MKGFILRCILWIPLGMAASGIAVPAQAPPEPATVSAAAPRAEDVATLDGIVRAYYEVISGPAGKRDWARDRTLYLPDIRFVDIGTDPRGRPLPQVRSHQAFVSAMDAYLCANGFYESEIHRVTSRFGDLTHVWSTYECREKPGGPVTARGINSLQLYWDGARWWIAAAAWTNEGPGRPIPPEYLPKKP